MILHSNKTIQRLDGQEYITVWLNDKKQLTVSRKPRHLRLQCAHDWCYVSDRGHGKWTRGCRYCGALSR